jgi:hypothetical protein
MATRTYCDQCGHTCHSPNKLMFGSFMVEPSANYVGQQGQQALGGIIYPPGPGNLGSIKMGNPVYSTPVYSPKWYDRVVIDLCDACAPVWIERVKALTQASDPDV